MRHGFHIGNATCTVAERASFDAGCDQRAIRHFLRIKITAILFHVLGGE